ncbi:VWA domain-containing protein [Acetobacter sacchari]|uniref:VWA domain-containing protein n=1 Tax=Acetobacter sacchari TaxID=2661687 RepID=A0ABS3LWW4_9PROT|nr:VWA domain-containing protein [Acetobacter sacchari]MBO1360410.1 VWA domain-containing protein [Acetobacter sacchari]
MSKRRNRPLPNGLHRLWKYAREMLLSLARARGGNVVVLTAFCALPVITAMGAAIDISRVHGAQTSLQSVSDAAALAAAKSGNLSVAAAESSSGRTSDAQAAASSAAQSFVSGNYLTSGLTSSPDLSISTTVSAANVVTVTVTLTYNQSLLFGSIFGISSTPVTVTSTATVALGSSYYQVVFLIDVSNSMGIGGTSTAIAALQSNRQIQCAFACHDPNSYSSVTTDCVSSSGGGNRHHGGSSSGASLCDKRAIAKAAGISLKIDYVSQAVEDFITQLDDYTGNDTTHFTVAIDTFGTNFTQALAPTTNLSSALTAAQNIDIETVLPWATYNYGYTYTQKALSSALSSITNVGDGSSPTKMRTFLVFLSDGAEDLPGPYVDYGRSLDVAYSSQCDALKNSGINIFSIWAHYYPIPTDSQYSTLVAPISANLGPTMQACASSSDQYFEASDGPAIQSAVSSSFVAIAAAVGLHLSK